MSSDFLLTWISWLDADKLDWDAGLAKLKEFAEEIRDENPDEFDSLDEVTMTECDYTYEELRSAYEELRTAINEATKYGYVPASTAYVVIGGLHMFITGGESWGDSPTEFFDVLDKVSRPVEPEEVNEVIGLDPDVVAMPSDLMRCLVKDHPKEQPLLIGVNKKLDEMITKELKDG